MKIHVKLSAFVSMALLVPLLIGIFYVRYFGRAYYEKQQGLLYLSLANELSGTLGFGVQQEFRHVLNWAGNGLFARLLGELPVEPVDMDEIRHIDSVWPNLSSDDEPLRSVLSNPIQGHLDAFKRIKPEFAEIFVTDRHGRVVAATNPTTDYWQADEAWWAEASSLPVGSGLIYGVVYDESARTLAVDMAVPVYTAAAPPEFLGVVKFSQSAFYLLERIGPHHWEREVSLGIFFPDGRLLATVEDGNSAGCSQLMESAMLALRNAPEGWAEVECAPGSRLLAAAVPVSVSTARFSVSGEAAGARELLVVVSQDLEEAMLPVRTVLRQLTFWGILAALFFAALCYVMARFWLVKPIRTLRQASICIVECIKQSEQGLFEESWQSRQDAAMKLADLNTIHSQDELQDLTTDFTRMGERLLNFLRQIEHKLTEKRRREEDAEK